MMLCHPGDQTLFISLATCPTWLVTQWGDSPNKYSGKGQTQFGLPGDWQGFVRIEFVRHTRQSIHTLQRDFSKMVPCSQSSFLYDQALSCRTYRIYKRSTAYVNEYACFFFIIHICIHVRDYKCI